MELTCVELLAKDLPTYGQSPDYRRGAGILVVDGDPSTLLAAYGPEWPGPHGVWFYADHTYPAALIAHDIKTLAHLMPLTHVVIEAPDRAEQHADIVRALLSDDHVTMANAVGHLQGAVNRPAPPAPLAVWYRDGTYLFNGEQSLGMTMHGPGFTLFED